MYSKNINDCPLCGQIFATQKARRTADETLANGIVAIYRERQQKEHLPCPKCGSDNMDEKVSRNALSRVADIQICDECGLLESLEAFDGVKHTLLNWWLIEEILP